jgi:hypothetical protein
LNTGVNLSDLLNAGTNNQASFEFWIKSTNTSNSWVLTDLLADEEALSLRVENNHQLKLKVKGVEESVDLDGKIGHNTWHHVAFVINGATTTLYINGRTRGVFNQLNFATTAHRNLYFYKNSQTELFVTEIRAWNSARTKQEIFRYWAQVFDANDAEAMTNYTGKGLAMLLNSTAQTLESEGKISRLTWQNSITGTTLAGASGISNYTPANVTLMNVSTEVGHPVLDLEEIFVAASKGEFTDKVQLKWNHIAKATSYVVLRKPQGAASFVALPNPPMVNTQRPGDNIVFEDQDIAAGERYVYKVQALGDHSFSVQGQSLGFIFYNGQISGKVTTNRQDPVQNVEIKVTKSTGGIAGHTLLFQANDPSIVVDNIEALRNQPNLTVEFWYKGTGNNTVFALGNSKITFTANKLTVTNADGSVYLDGTLHTQDAAWHHYAFTFAPVLNEEQQPIGAEGKLYQDHQVVATANTAYQPPLGNVTSFSIGYENNGTYQLDEFKVWSIAKSPKLIEQTHAHVISGEETGLLLYYRFDEGSGKEVYNYALANRNEYIGKSSINNQDIAWSNQQHAGLYYGTLTSTAGAYLLRGLNYGTSGSGTNFHVTPQKPNHEFRTVPAEVLLQRGHTINKADVDFTDISQFTISGRMFYEEAGQQYPVPQGQQVLLDNGTAQVLGPGDHAKTDATGLFTTSASPERLTISVQAPELKRNNLVNQSLRFDGQTAYAQSEGTIVHSGDATWSFWVKPASANEQFEGETTEGSRTLPAEQTIFHIGNIKLDLEGSTLVLKKGDTELIRSTQSLSNQAIAFCAMSYNATTQQFTLYVGNTPDVSAAVGGADLAGRFTLGAAWVNNAIATPFRGHIDHIEFRTRAFANNEFKALKEGSGIANNSQELKLSYPIIAANGVRELSLTEQAKYQPLKLAGNTQRDNKIVAATQGSYQHEYIASNAAYNPAGGAYTLNIDGVKTDLNFKNTTRYGFAGNLVVPCDYTIGNLRGRIFRTDITGFEKTFDMSNFSNVASNLFVIDGLIPGQYRVEIFRQEASPNTEPLLRSPVIDITQGWATYDFEYHNPLQVSYEIYEVDIISRVNNQQKEHGGKRGERVAPLCNGNYALNAHQNYELELTVSEDYGGQGCQIEGITYEVSGTMGTWLDKDQKNVVATSIGTTNEEGKAVVRFLSSSPSFDAQDYLEQMQIVARTQNRNTTITAKAFIKGTQQLTSDFTLQEPEILHVLHDPPGDGSSATLAKGSSIAYAVNTETEAGFETATKFLAGTGVKVQTGGGFGAVILTETLNARNLVGVTLGVKNENTLTTQNLWTLTTEEEYSTSSGEDIVGPDADLFIGAGKVITYGGARKLVIDNATCTASIQSVPQSISQTYTTPFAFTAQHIRDVTIPGFDKLIQDERTKVTNGTQTQVAADKVIAGYEHQKSSWQAALDKNYRKIQNTAQNNKAIEHGFTAGINSLDYPNKDFAFAGGGQTYSASLQWSQDNNISNSHKLVGSIGTTINADNVIFGVRFKSETAITGTVGLTLGSDNSNGSSTGVSFTLADGDQGDQFYVLMRRDTDYNTPIFLTIGGRSSCPYERNTQPREGVRIETLNGNTQVTPAGTKAVYQLRLTNTQISEDATDKAYIVAVDESSNSKGAKILLNGAPLGNGRRFMLSPKASTTAELTIEQNASGATEYDGVKIRFYSECEFGLDNTFSYTPDELYERDDDGNVKTDANGTPISLVKIVDEVSLNTYFRTPCVSHLNIASPTANWVVNNTSNNQLYLRFKPESAQSDLKKIEVEYATEANNNAQLLTTLNMVDLTADSEGFYTASLQVGALADGKYSLRLVPVCGTAGTNRNNVSEWLEGTIQRTAPIIASVSPVNNGTLGSDGVISATYTDRISNAGVNSLNVNVMGVLANDNYVPTAARFAETTDEIQIPHQEVLNLSSYAVEFWVKTLHPSAEVSIIEKGSNFRVAIQADGKIKTAHLTSSEALTPNAWAHVAVVYDGTAQSSQLYLNGRLVGAQTLVPTAQLNTDAISIAKAAAGQAFRGSLDEIRIWNVARTSNQIINNYQRMLLGNETGLVGYYRLDNNALEVNGVQEGIRDFTGTASGTVATGISWVNNQEAAPLKVNAVAQTIPATITLSNERDILISPTLADSDLEGAYLTVTIADRKITDLLGNKIEGKSWSFRYDKNLVSWDRRRVDLTQTWQQAKRFTMSLQNQGATDVTYQLTDLPEWIKTPNKAKDNAYTLTTGQNESIEFEAQPWLNAGEHNGVIKAKIFASDGRLLGTEQVAVNVQVNCAPPVYTLNPAQYRYSMFFNASVHINGQRSIDENDQVVVLANNAQGVPEVRGKASLTKTGDQYAVSLLIYSNQTSAEPLQFRVWDASACREYDHVVESYAFTNNVTLNNQTLTVGTALRRRFQAIPGYQYVTFNAVDVGQNTLSIGKITGLPNGAKIYVQGVAEAVATYDGHAWSGTLTQLQPTKAYQIYSPAAAEVILQGNAVDLNTQIQVNTGINWLAYLPDQTFTVGKALSSLNVSNTNNLYINGHNSFSQYNVATGKWVGTLEYLAPNQGYRLTSLGAGTLNYATSLGSAATGNSRLAQALEMNKPMYEVRNEAKILGMQVEPSKYRYVTHVVGMLTDQGQRLDNADYILTAHTSRGEVRGVAIPQEVNGQLMYFMSIYTQDPGAVFNLRLTHRKTQAVQTLSNRVNYQAKVQGTLAQPYEFRITQEAAGASTLAGYRLYQNQPNPFYKTTTISYELPQADDIRLAVYNTQGQEVAILASGKKAAGKHTVQWKPQDLPAGVYFYTLTGGNTSPLTKRLVIH